MLSQDFCPVTQEYYPIRANAKCPRAAIYIHIIVVRAFIELVMDTRSPELGYTPSVSIVSGVGGRS
jgi:hypothetical protein